MSLFLNFESAVKTFIDRNYDERVPILKQFDGRVQQHEPGSTRWTHQAAHERVHGLVADPAQKNRFGQPEDAQFRNFETPRRRMEALE